MSRNAKYKLAIVAGISDCLVYAEAKYCAFEIHGEPKYYVCPRTEYCCNFGCCVSPGYQIYHLWYYWLLVIIMFLVCSGGGWWYRYWLQGRYRAAASAIPTRSSSTRTQNALRGPTCQAQQARISYNTARNTVLLHRMWKGPHRSASSPAYSAAGSASTAAHYQNTSVVLNDANCPYYQLYGPPPSYETVIAQSRGKISTPSSPELMRPPTGPQQQQQQQLPQQQRPVIDDPTFAVGPCYYGVPAPQYQPTAQPPAFDSAEYVRLVQQYGPVMMSPRHQPHYPTAELPIRGAYDRSSIMHTSSKSSSNSEAESNAINSGSQMESPEEGGFSVARIDCIGSPCALDRPLQCYAPINKFTSRAGIHGIHRRERTKCDSTYSSQLELMSEPIATTSSSRGFDFASSSSTSHRPLSRSELRKIQGGSLKIPRKRDQHRHQEVYASTTMQRGASVNRRLSSVDFERASTSSYNASAEQHQQQQPVPTNPSSNVILAANAISKSAVDDKVATSSENEQSKQQRQEGQHRHSQQQQQPSTAATNAERSSTNSNLESKRKLDRSRSLD